jgi:hypothetical protein
VSAADRAEMQRLLAAAFERRGWEYDLETVPAILGEVERTGAVGPTQLAGRVSSQYLNRVGASRGDMADAIAEAIGGRTLAPQPSAAPAVTIDNRNSINFGPGAQIGGSANLNTGSQISVRGDSPKEDVLDAIATLVTAGLGGEWNTEEADELDRAIAGREDIAAADVQAVTVRAAENAGGDGVSRKAFAQQLAAEAGSSLLVAAILAAVQSLH